MESEEKGKEIIDKLDYSTTQVLIALCSLPGFTAHQALFLLSGLAEEPVPIESAALFIKYCEREDVTAEIGMTALQRIRKLDITSVWAAQSLLTISSLKAVDVLDFLSAIGELSNSGRWAAKSFFEIQGQTKTSISRGLEMISSFPDELCWPVEASNKIPSITVSQALENMEVISTLSPDDAWNVQALFELPGMSGSEALFWLTGYFEVSFAERELYFRTLSPSQKTALLNAFLSASDYIIRDINNLHTITRLDGSEISQSELAASSFDDLFSLFTRLPLESRKSYEAFFSKHVKSVNKKAAIHLLQKATAHARFEAARKQSAANLYILLSRVSILYDSSYRLVLIPELYRRIRTQYQGSLLTFIQDIDPEGVHVADFVAGLAQKGRLAMFFPPGLAAQKKILTIVTASAYRSEKSLVIFAATFEKLLNGVLPEARSFLLDSLIELAKGKGLLAKQVRVILQYYLEEQPALLGKIMSDQMKKVFDEHTPVPLSKYRETPFVEWVQDGKLSSLSVFHGDDDGRISFISNCRYLLKNGYKPSVSRTFLQNHLGQNGVETLAGILSEVTNDSSESRVMLFDFLKQHPVAVEFQKTVGSVQISHSFAVYQNSFTALQLMEEFINGGHEMFAHRGHSYWLEEHILDPLQELLSSGKLKREDVSSKQRFLSIGACGGINIYFDLTRTFCNRIDLLGSIGAGKTVVNNLYNRFLFEIIASGPLDMSWKEVDNRSAFIFEYDPQKDYQLPGGLPALLYKIIGEGRCWF